MKKKILATTAALMLAITVTTSFAQSGEIAKVPSTEKAMNTFEDQFGQSVEPSVYNQANGRIILKASVDSRAVTSVFTKKGNWVYTIMRYPSQSLSKDVIELVQKDYDTRGFYITSMEKIDQPGHSTVYLVHLKGTGSIKTLRVSDSGIDEISRYQTV